MARTLSLVTSQPGWIVCGHPPLCSDCWNEPRVAVGPTLTTEPRANFSLEWKVYGRCRSSCSAVATGDTALTREQLDGTPPQTKPIQQFADGSRSLRCLILVLPFPFAGLLPPIFDADNSNGRVPLLSSPGASDQHDASPDYPPFPLTLFLRRLRDDLVGPARPPNARANARRHFCRQTPLGVSREPFCQNLTFAPLCRPAALACVTEGWFACHLVRRLRLRLHHRRLCDYPGGPAPLPNARAVARRHFCRQTPPGVGREPFCQKLTFAPLCCRPLLACVCEGQSMFQLDRRLLSSRTNRAV